MKGTGLFALALLTAGYARADLTQIDVDNGYFSGRIFAFPLPNPTSVTGPEGGAGLNLIPVSYALTRKPNLSQPAGFTTDIAIEQVKVYIIPTNQFQPITPRTIVSLPNNVSKVAGSDSGVNGIEDFAAAKFFNAFANSPYNKDEYRFGKYRFRIKISISGGAFAEIFSSEFVVSPVGLRDANLEGGSNPSGGGGITPDDLNGQPVNQSGFWEGIFSSLFIPDPETVATLRDAVLQFGTWGPFGIIGAINTRINEYSQGAQELDYRFSIDLPIAGPTDMDLTPYSGFIKISRVFMAMSLWFAVVWRLWDKVYKKV